LSLSAALCEAAPKRAHAATLAILLPPLLRSLASDHAVLAETAASPPTTPSSPRLRPRLRPRRPRRDCGLASDHAVLAETALALFERQGFVGGAVSTAKSTALPKLVPVLLRRGEKHWSAAINTARYRALTALRSLDAALFDASADAPTAEEAQAMVEKLAPAQAGPRAEGEGGSSERGSLALAPTLLPELAFQELVFAEELGSGAFATVRRARHIVKGRPASEWDEYAIKVVPLAVLQPHGYEASVRREMAVLRVLTHPGIARLVATFRWRDGAYLVMEFAAKGDLHTLLQDRGSLNEAAARFVTGEVVAALHSVHSTGFAYGDLKPENVLLTASGHAKLGDFGAARPITPQGYGIVEEARNIVGTLRDGDWRVKRGIAIPAQPEAPGEETAVAASSGDGEGEGEEDRLEGTLAYLAPEVVRGGAMTRASDCWGGSRVLPVHVPRGAAAGVGRGRRRARRRHPRLSPLRARFPARVP